VVGNDIRRIARHEQTLETRIEGKQFFGQLPAVHFRHDDVGQQQMNLSGVLFRQLDGLARGACGQHPISLHFQQLSAQIENCRFVFNNKHGLMTAFGRFHRP